MNEGSGSTAVDSIGSSNGTYNGTATFTTSLISGQTYAMEFDGSSTYMSCGFDDPASSGSWTVEMVLKNAQSSFGGRRLANDHTDSNAKGFQVRYGSSAVSFDIYSNSILDGPVSSSMVYVVHCVYDNASKSGAFYVNGEIIGRQAMANVYQSATQALTVGRNPSYLGDYWAGTAQDLATYSAVLTPETIASHVSAAFGGWCRI